jgi:multisubunit Na+/H+ antiporter MnhF subunit
LSHYLLLVGMDVHRLGNQLAAAACTYRIALGPRAGQKVLSFQTVPTQAVQPT